ncbi:DUF938 domain-containing protein [Pukyongiella litopenaei]|uniref:DUF938 domain-containing protein n=1 Tax=Pukyongiella litopenaei TaxID=2605946 RepID=A0A2S0MSZ5_9RHOB|nr:DUF938 domain-containing protein [Pukyongiella litopenaei]AVO39004.1 DUF938 domain-containing protein [Pukyongiella litopenaei]
MIRKSLPATASFAHPQEGDRLFAPSAASNAPPICDLLDRYAPETGAALELASGTGQHVVAFAATRPGLTWQPTEPDAVRRASIAAHVADAGLTNVAPPLALDAARPGWSASQSGKALVVLVNLLHLISDTEAETVIAETARALALDGRFLLYGPFMRAGALTSDGDRSFHAALQASDPEIGYKDDRQVAGWARSAGLTPVARVEMPANNLALVWERRRT